MADNSTHNKKSSSIDYSLTNRELIDKQQETFLSIFNDLSDLQDQENNHQLLSIIERLGEYSSNELKKEERPMLLAGYPNYEEHILQHKLFSDRINGFKLQYDYNNPYLADNIFHFLKKWFVSHILNADRESREAIFEKGLIRKAQLLHHTAPDSKDKVELESYKTGIDLIDEHQETFMSIFNDISKIQRNGNDNEDTLSIIQRLEKYANGELKKEEELLRVAGFHNYKKHLLHHELFLAKVEHFKLQHNYNNSYLSSNILHFLKKWLVAHIFSADKEYRQLVIEYTNASKYINKNTSI